MKILNQNKASMYSSNLKQSNKKVKENMEKMSSGKKINKAKDDAAGLAIAQNLDSLVKGLDKANQNITNSNSALNVADGSLGSISSNLQRIRELGVTASSSLLSSDDKKIIQGEINEIIKNIDSTANNAEFNGKKLLDGSFKDMNVANNSDGSGTEISISSSTANELGIAGFDVTGDKIDLSVIDKALDKVNSNRVNIGASSNRLDHTFSSNENTALNLAASKSKIEDTDMAKASMDNSMNKALTQYNMFVQKNVMKTQSNMLNILF